jgi:hypothetical protein
MVPAEAAAVDSVTPAVDRVVHGRTAENVKSEAAEVVSEE